MLRQIWVRKNYKKPIKGEITFKKVNPEAEDKLFLKEIKFS